MELKHFILPNNPLRQILIFIIFKTIMPTYEYECKSCSHKFEVFQSINDPPIKDCPECGNEVRRLIFGGTGVIFKGSGFYVTDKNKSSGEKAAKSTAAADAKPAPDAKPKSGESPQSAPATPAPCSECPKKGSSPSCPA
jgi:putative FmdB family regulatory protein